MRAKYRIVDLSKHHIGEHIRVEGWIRTCRSQKTFSFVEINDGSCLHNLQGIIDDSIPSYAEILPTFSTGAAVCLEGIVSPSPGGKQDFELKVHKATLIGECPTDFPLQKKRHSFEFLREIAHLRARTNTQGAVARVRSTLAYATHSFFQERGFVYLQSPIITASDCEGAGEMFQVTTFDLQKVPHLPSGSIDYSKDFFGKPAYLTVSGQLNGEAYATALGNIYTFGPTFRAENSHTSRHLAEFWMIEPEMAFADIETVKEVAEAYVKHLIKETLRLRSEDIDFFEAFIEPGLKGRLEHVLHSPFERITYTQAIDILLHSGRSFTYPVAWGNDLQSEHERFIAEEYFKKPVIITDYPKGIKAFYMRDNPDGQTVAAMDVIVPKIGEIIGGSQREERYDVLYKKIIDMGLDPASYSWYLDLRKYGSVPHGGFGLGFERVVQFITGIENIRDAIAFPRTAGSAEF